VKRKPKNLNIIPTIDNMKKKLNCILVVCLCFMMEYTYAQVSFPDDFLTIKEHKVRYPQITEQMFDTIFSRYKPKDYSDGLFYKYQFLFKLYDTKIYANLYLLEISHLCSHPCNRIYAIDKINQKILDSVDINTFNKLIEYSRLNKFDQALSWMIFNNLENRIVLFKNDSIKFANKSSLLNLISITYRIGNIPNTFFNSLNQDKDTVHIILFNSKDNHIEKYFFYFNNDGALMSVFKKSYKDLSPYRVLYLKKRKRISDK